MALISKALARLRSPRNSISGFIVNAPHQWGQPYSVSATDSAVVITPQRMRELAMKGPTVAMCVNAIVDYVTGVPMTVRNKNPAIKADPAEVKYVESFFRKPNKDQTGLHVDSALVRDLVVIGFAGQEIIPDVNNRPAEIRNIDAVKLYMDYTEHGELLGYNQLDAHGMPITTADGDHAWKPEEVILYQRNPQTKSPYPFGQLEQLFACAVVEMLMLNFIGARFTESNMPYGILDLGDITPDELKKAVASWNSQVESQHRIMLTNTRNGGKWIPFGYHLKDLEATAILDKLESMQMGIMGVTKNEAGDSQDVSKANGFYLSYTFKNRAILPVLRELAATRTKFVEDRLGLEDLEVAANEIDSRDELLQVQIDDMELKIGLKSVNEIRNRNGDVSIKGGEQPFLFANGSWIPISMANEMALAQLRAVLAEASLLEAQVEQAQMMLQMGMQAGGPGGTPTPISPPMIRAPKALETFTTPDAPGSSSFKHKYPRPQPLKGNANGPPQKPRGPVQTLHNQGMRTDAGSP